MHPLNQTVYLVLRGSDLGGFHCIYFSFDINPLYIPMLTG